MSGAGRAFTRLDRSESPLVLMVNETLARELFGGEPAVGQRLLPVGAGPEPWEVIGVVADVRYGGLTINESQAEAYMPLRQLERAGILGGMSFTSVVALRTASDPAAVVPFLREAVAAGSPNASIDDLMTMEARLSSRFSPAGCRAAGLPASTRWTPFGWSRLHGCEEGSIRPEARASSYAGRGGRRRPPGPVLGRLLGAVRESATLRGPFEGRRSSRRPPGPIEGADRRGRPPRRAGGEINDPPRPQFRCHSGW